MRPHLLKAEQVTVAYNQGSGYSNAILQNIDLSLYEGEIVSLVGTSGSGKSSLLRTFAGLMQPSHGQVFYQDQPIHGPVPQMSMVFQEFTLLPWLTVLENVQLGLEARKLPAQICKDQALQAIDIVGLDGFESAFPRELSGGMCQRVGIARALAVEPGILFLDEPFSALDTLTAENLKSDILDIWHNHQKHLKCILLVTHNIDEAVRMSDRILILGGNPSHICADIPINLTYPRDDCEQEITTLIDEVYYQITQSTRSRRQRTIPARSLRLDMPLPHVNVEEIIGLIEAVSGPQESPHVELAELSEENHLELGKLLAITDACEHLKLCHIIDGHMSLTALGHEFAQAGILEKKQLFANQCLTQVPLARYIRHCLDESDSHQAKYSTFHHLLTHHMTQDKANDTLETVISWGRYAEIFAYDDNTSILSLDDPS